VLKDAFFDALGVCICRLQLQLGTERRKEGEERWKEKKEVKRCRTCSEHRWTHTMPRLGTIPGSVCGPSQRHGGFGAVGAVQYSSQHVLL